MIDPQLQALLDIEECHDETSSKEVPREVYIGETPNNLHYCYHIGYEGFLASFDNPNVGRLVTAQSPVNSDLLKTMQYRKVKFEEALALSLVKKGLKGVVHFFTVEEYRKVYNG